MIYACLLSFFLVAGLFLTYFSFLSQFIVYEKETFAFALPLFLYLSIEELLSHDHEEKDKKLSMVMFFIGFLFILLQKIH